MNQIAYTVKADECFPEIVLSLINENDWCDGVESEINYNALDATWSITLSSTDDDYLGRLCTELDELFTDYGFLIV